MRVSINSLLLTLLILSVSCSTSKQLNQKNWVQGKWLITDLDTGERVEEKYKEEYKQMMEKMIRNAYMEFGKKQSFEMLLMGQKLEGEYRLLDDNKALAVLVEGESKEDIFQILSCTQDSMIIEAEDGEGKMKIYMKRTDQTNE
jgi:hypothetical protein